MVNVKILRVFLDGSSLGGRGYYSPLHRELGCASLIPIPEDPLLLREEYRVNPPSFMDPDKWIDVCTGRVISSFMPIRPPIRLNEFVRGVPSRKGIAYREPWILHNDPRIDRGFYTDTGSRIPRELKRGDILFFAAGLAEYPRDFWNRRRTLSSIINAFNRAREEGKAGIYLVGGIVVKEVVHLDTNEDWEKAISMHSYLRESPHFYRLNRSAIAIIGRGFTVSPPAPLTIPRRGSSLGTPSRLLQEILGKEAAHSFVRGNARISKLVEVVSMEKIFDMLAVEGLSGL